MKKKISYTQILSDIELSSRSIDHEYFRNKSILITGSSGLIGTYLLAYFFIINQAGYNTKVTSISHSEPPEYVQELIEQGGMTHLELDLTDFNQYEKIPTSDIIIHAAGYAQPSVFMANPATTLTINVAATLALLKKLNENGSFIFLSSSEVYCGHAGGPCNENVCGNTTPYHPRASYIEGKRAGEAACSAYRMQGIRTISVRLGDVYGPGTRKHDQRALNSFIEQALVSGEIKLRDQGAALRTYCYVPDAVESILNILTHGREQVYNVGGPIFTSIKELALLIGGLTKVAVKFPEVNDQIAGSPEALNLDMTRLTNEFMKSEYVTLEDGLLRTIKWQSQIYAKELNCD